MYNVRQACFVGKQARCLSDKFPKIFLENVSVSKKAENIILSTSACAPESRHVVCD
jgi:hypothetical protein